MASIGIQRISLSAVLILVALASGCGRDQASVSSSLTTSTTTLLATPTTASGSPSPTTVASLAPPTTASAAVPVGCFASELKIDLGEPDGAAGSVYYPLVFTNTGRRVCELHGFPAVSYVDGPNGTQVGNAASRSGEEGEVVSLPPGGSASATVRLAQVGNYPAGLCKPTEVAGLRVYPPDDFDALFVAHPGTGCASADPQVHQLEITTVVAGGGGP